MQASMSAVCISSVLCSWSAPASKRNLTMSKCPKEQDTVNFIPKGFKRIDVITVGHIWYII